MKNPNTGLMYARFVVFTLLLSLLAFQTTPAFAVSDRGLASAEILVSGPTDGGEKPFAVVNGERAFSGRTFFSDGTVSTTETSSATISLGKLGRIVLAPSSSLTLSFSEGRISGMLSKGQVSVTNTDGVAVTIDTPNDSVKNEGNSPSRFAVAVTGGQTALAVESGSVRTSNGTVKQDDDDDDDDDDHWKAWAWVAVIAGTVTAIILITTLGDDDDDVVSPVR
jgi:hypothetical protein